MRSRRQLTLCLVLAGGLLAVGLGTSGRCRAGGPAAPDEKPVRQIFIPFADLPVVLENQPRRVLLSRQEFDQLRQQAKKTPETPAPQAVVVAAAEYAATIRTQQRAEISGTLSLEVLEDGLHAVPLDLGGVGLLSATLDDRPAPIGGDGGRLVLLVEGRGRHRLRLEVAAPLITTAAQQIVTFHLPRPPAAQMSLTVPGDVEVKSGADVVRREVDATARVTRFQLLPRGGDTTLVMTLNSHLQKQQRAVIASSVMIYEVTQAYEKLHATVSLKILYRAVDQFRFAVPAGFEVLSVNSPLLSRWDVTADNQQRVLNVRLREQTTDDVVLNIVAVRTGVDLAHWQAPRLVPLDVLGQVAVVGLFTENSLRAQALEPKDLIPIDVQVLHGALPTSLLTPVPGEPALLPVAAYYAPQGDYSLTGALARPAAGLAVNTNLLLTLEDRGQQVRGGFAVLPEGEKRFAIDFSVPAGWIVESVTDPGEHALAFERYGAIDQPGRIHVRLPQGIAAGAEYQLHFLAVRTPPGWLDDWQSKPQTVEFPVFAVVGATRDEGAIAVDARDDLTVRCDPAGRDQLTLLDEAEKARYGLKDVATSLAYRYEGQGYHATLTVARTPPRLTARTLAFFQVKPDLLTAHYEIIYQVDDARARQLLLALPIGTPSALTIRGLEGLRLKEFNSRDDDAKKQRLWTVLLEDARQGKLHLAVDFDQQLSAEQAKDYTLPMLVAVGDDVDYQSGLAAVEGSAELNVQIKTDARKVDVGELVDADYQPGDRLLGAYGFVGPPAVLRILVSRDPACAIYPAVAERAVLSTHLSPDGTAQTEADFRLRTKALFLDLQLPKGAELWSAMLDGQPIKPQRHDDRVLVSLPASTVAAARDLQFVYAMNVRSVTFSGKVAVPAPKLLLRADKGQQPEEVPLNDLAWRLYLPTGYEVTRSGGTVEPTHVERPQLAAVEVAKLLYGLTGGLHPFYGVDRIASQATQTALIESRSAAGRGAAPSSAEPDVGGQTLPLPDNAVADVQHFPEGHKFILHDEAAAQREEAKKDSAKTPSMVFDTEQRAEEKPADKPAPAPKAEPPMSAPKPPPPPATPAPTTELNARGEKIDGTSATVVATETPSYTVVKPEYETGRRSSLKGQRSLKIELNQGQSGGGAIEFRSLGVAPLLEVTLANRDRFEMLGWGLALGVILLGLTQTDQSLGRKVRLILGIAVLATVVPLLWRSIEVARVCNFVFYATSLLVPYYLLAGLVKWIVRGCRKLVHRRTAAAATTAAALLLAVGWLAAPAAVAAQELKADGVTVQVLPAPQPVQVPDDAIIVPYDPKSKADVAKAERLLVPYAQFVELWNRAHPDKKLETKPAPLPFALAGAAYATTLLGDDYLQVTGQLQIDCFADGYQQVPLELAGGVLTKAELDGQPARLNFVAAAAPPVAQAAKPMAQQAAPPPPAAGMIVLQLSGKGRHKLELVARLKLTRQGGWRIVDGRLPWAPAAALTISVPNAHTELRVEEVGQRRLQETLKDGEQIAAALGAGGTVKLQWRPKLNEAQVDRSLTARSTAVFDAEEDGLRMVCRLALEFRRSQRDRFTLRAPKEYRVEKVDGPNVRGWQLKEDAAGQAVEVELLKAAKDQEELTVSLLRIAAVGKQLKEFAVPLVDVPDAAMYAGEVTIRRSPLLDLRAVAWDGLTRTDLNADAARLAGDAARQRPWPLRPFQAYRFASRDCTLKLAAEPLAGEVAATVQSIVNLAEYRRTLESRVLLAPRARPLYRVEMLLPAGMKLESVEVPVEHQWATRAAGPRQLLTIYLAKGCDGELPIVLRGLLSRAAPKDNIPLPQLEVRGVDRQEGEIAVQVDPAYDVDPRDLTGCQTEVGRVPPWLQPQQRALMRLVLRYRQGDYAGGLRLIARQATVVCNTITNVKVTRRAIEETILLDFAIENAGVRRLAFTLPEGYGKARIKARALRAPTVDAQPGQPVRVTLEFQEEVMGVLRVIVENDRLLEREKDYQAPIPHVEPIAGTRQFRVDRRYVALESAGRDEVEIVTPVRGLEPLSRQSKEFQALAAKLRGGITWAYVVAGDAAAPRLAFRTRQRQAVETAGARILLAETELVLDANGAYRAQQVYHIDNRTEQFLEVQLPAGAKLWTARVAGSPVKPTRPPQATDDRLVRLSLVKTAPGDLDYEVALRYGGTLPRLGAFGKVDFPLPHTLNVNPEASVVQLYLPRDYQWPDAAFGGTMRQVFQQADVQAEQVAYQTKRAQQLGVALQSGDTFSQVRALNSLKNLKSELQVLTDNSSSMRTNDNWRNEFSTNTAVVQQVEKDAQSAQQGLAVAQQANPNAPPSIQSTAPRLPTTPQQRGGEGEQPAPADTFTMNGNRVALNDYYEGQRVSRARNVAQDVGANFSNGTIQVKSGTLQFNENWLDSNKLANPQAQPPAKESGERGPGTKPGGGEQGGKVQWVAPPQQAAQALNPKAPEVAQGKGKKQLVQSQTDELRDRNLSQGSLTLSGNNSYSGEQVLKYQQRLEANTNANAYGGNVAMQPQVTTPPPPPLTVTGAGTLTIAPPQQPVVAGTGSITAQPSQQPSSTVTQPGYYQPGIVPGPSTTPSPAPPNATNFGLSPQQWRQSPSDRQGQVNGGVDQSQSGTYQVADLVLPTQPSGAPAAVQPPAPPAGLASLDVAMPLRDDFYQVYRFTTPLGKTELTAWTASNDLLSSLANLGIVAAVLLAAAVVVWVFRSAGRNWFAGNHGSTVLIVLGLVSLLFGLWPVVGLAALLTGIGLKIRNAARRRAQLRPAVPELVPPAAAK